MSYLCRRFEEFLILKLTMKGMKLTAGFLCFSLVLSSCGMSNTGKGSIIGAGGGAALGSLIGALASQNKGKGAAIGAAVGTAVGVTAGALIGKKMDKAAAQAEQIEGAQVEQVTDNNGLQAVKVTFDSGILFNTSSATIKYSCQICIEQICQQRA